jgi:hypothetical protein
LLFEDYWGETTLYDEKQFRRTFRMPRGLSDQILEQITVHDQYFIQKRDACKVLLLYLASSVFPTNN